jgi:exopolysaccharide biosynthesis polyprenyl glycosylphosphotransferase
MIWKSHLNQTIAQITDFIAVLALLFVSYFIWKFSFPDGQLQHINGSAFSTSSLLIIAIVVAFCFVIIFTNFRAYNFHRFTSLATEYTLVFTVVMLGFLIVIALLYMLRFATISRMLVIISLFTIFTGLLAEKTIMFYVAKLVRKHQPQQRIIIIGSGKTVEKLIHTIHNRFHWGINILGVLIPNHDEKTVLPLKILGHFPDIGKVLKEYNPEEVIISLATNDMSELKYVYEECERVGVQVRLVSDFFMHMAKNIKVDNIYGINFISFYPYLKTNLEKTIKRTIDIMVSFIAIILLLPFFAIISVLIFMQDGWPVLFNWKIMGLNRKPITSWKFRSMYKNADEIKKELLQYNEMRGPMFKMENDPRIFPIGKFLRKYSLDELPQLFSVLKGDLSLVGPRPPLQYEFKEFDLWHRRKLSVKPGITCLWQISGRNNINNFDDWVKLDLEYIDNWSLVLDLKILLKTIPAVLRGTGK